MHGVIPPQVQDPAFAFVELIRFLSAERLEYNQMYSEDYLI